MGDAGKVEFDTAELDRKMAAFGTAMGQVARPVATGQAINVADKIRTALPHLTGRLASSVTVSSYTNGAEVHYGGGVPYAGYIDKRTGATGKGVAGCEQAFTAAMLLAAEAAIRKIF